jgi:hypothetical protein
MKTVDLEIARNKIKTLSELLDGLAHVGPGDSLQAYYAAKLIRNGNLRSGVERRWRAAQKAAKAFNVVVSIANNPRGVPTVRLYAPTKQIEIFM